MQWLGIDLVSLSQGVPFFHAGVDLLRSKSMDRNSYNSGDWFNRLDFTYQTNNWAVGLPGGDNADMYAVIQPLLADPNIRPTSAEITSTHQHFMEMLQIRRSSVLFRLRTAEDIEQRLVFDNTGPDQVPGVIVMSISDMGDLEDLDPNYEYIVVVFNGTPDEVAYALDAAVGLTMELHPVQAASADSVVQGASFDSATGTFTVPGRTTAVFVLAQ
jgi:pullulanase/glycogen debranching enzyme